MKHQVYFGITIRIILLFGVAMLATFIPEHLREFFADEDCTNNVYYMYGKKFIGCQGAEVINDGYDWGVRHYWYFWGMLLLFLLSLANVVVSIVNLVNKHYPDIK